MHRYFYILFLSCLLFSACDTKKPYVPIDVSGTVGLATSSQWAVIIDPYVSYRTVPGDLAKASTYGRTGDVIEVIGSTIADYSGTKILWYQFENGWLPETILNVYTNKLQAEFMATGL
ncbi:MAG: hypothetical protein R3Y36_07765 [Spirochaetales bacterium]